MATTDVRPAEERISAVDRLVNDFSLQVATVNGSGSQSSNLVLLRTIFAMGIPVSGKNRFPSNIAGLPTWYTIRASRDGYVARRKEVEFMVCMNAETAREDVLGLQAGAAVVYDQPLNLQPLRDDLVYYPVPFDQIVAAVCPDAKLRKLVRNMVYVGVVAHLLQMEIAEVEKAVRQQFKKKVKAADLNFAAVRAGYDYAAANLPKRDRCYLERMNATKGKIVIDGNSAAALGCMFAGVSVVGWYPITPSSSLVENLIGYMKKYRIDAETGKATFAIVQAEDELASAGMVLGAGWMGARAMTATSGPGISLMAEFIGLGYYAEIPGVFFDVQRVGPSTGLPTRTAQQDIGFLATLSHGDTKHILLIPGSVKECFEFAIAAFDLAEGQQTPVFVVTDVDLGMNNWMSEPFEYPKQPMNRGKVLTAEALAKLPDWGRYKDIDGDGIPYRTLPGTDHPQAAYFTRGTGHNEYALYSERPDDYQQNLDRLARKFEGARERVPQPVVEIEGKGAIGLIAYGTSDPAVQESHRQLLQETGVDAGYLRLRAYPFAAAVADFVRRFERVYVVDQNRDGQMYDLLRLDLEAELASRLRSVRFYNGLPMDARSLTDTLREQEGI